MARNPRKKKKSGHPGRGKPRVTRSNQRTAYGLVSSTDSPDESAIVDERGMRLNRWLSEQGVDSRRKCDAMVQQGLVEVNGEVMLQPGYRVQKSDKVSVEGRNVKQMRRLYYLFYKPKGVLCTNDPRENRPRVADLVDHLVPSRVYPVGRLDEDSEGLILLTNDGDFANFVSHPRYGVPKTYTVLVRKTVPKKILALLRKGTWLDGQKVIPASVRIARQSHSSTLFEVVLKEGRNREIRRLFAHYDMKVTTLKRVRIGGLGVKGISRGGLRPLTRKERDSLASCAEGTS